MKIPSKKCLARNMQISFVSAITSYSRKTILLQVVFLQDLQDLALKVVHILQVLHYNEGFHAGNNNLAMILQEKM